jgi:hypothetical protein
MASNKKRQELYIEYIAQGLDDKEAMAKAGYSERTITCKWKEIKENAFKKYNYKDIAVEALEKQLKDGIPLKPPNIKTPTEILEWWSSLLDNPDIKMEYKIKVSEYIAKCHGMFIQKIEVNHTNYSEVLNQARQRLEDNSTINITPQEMN